MEILNLAGFNTVKVNHLTVATQASNNKHLWFEKASDCLLQLAAAQIFHYGVAENESSELFQEQMYIMGHTSLLMYI